MGSTFYGFSSTSRTAGISPFFPHLATYLAKKWTNHQNGMGFRKLKSAEALRVAGSLPFSSPATASQGSFRQIELPLLNPSGTQHLRYQLQRLLQNTVTARNYSPSNLNFVMASWINLFSHQCYPLSLNHFPSLLHATLPFIYSQAVIASPRLLYLPSLSLSKQAP